MPRDTFFNLPEHKRRRFVDAALDQFARHPYDRASVTALTKAIGIAKGSFYQYFEDKFELLTWLLSVAAQRKMAIVGQVVHDDRDLWSGLRAGYAGGLRMWRDEPRLAAVVLHLQQPSVEPRLQALRRAQVEGATAWVRDQLARGQAAGQVRAEVDLDVSAALVHAALSEGLLRAMLARAGVGLDDLVAAPERVGQLADSDLEHVIDEALTFLQRGLGPARITSRR